MSNPEQANYPYQALPQEDRPPNQPPQNLPPYQPMLNQPPQNVPPYQPMPNQPPQNPPGAYPVYQQYPPPYQPPQAGNYPPQAGNYPPQPGNYPPQTGNYPQQYPGMQAVVVQGQPANPQPVLAHQFVFTRQPMLINCPYCHAEVMTNTSTHVGVLPWILCVGLCCIGCIYGCCLIPFCITDLQDVVHYCPNCNHMVGKKSSIQVK